MTGSRRLHLAGNWKMFKGASETVSFCRELRERLPADGEVDVVVCPPFTSLAAALGELAGSPVAVFAQNVHWEREGAYTGEVSADMLLELGVAGSLVGHSERRRLFGETDESVAARAERAVASGLRVIACVGELAEERERGETEDVLGRQVGAIAAAVGPHERLILAYEPVWAIGTGNVASTQQAQDAHAFIRSLVDVPVLYGGSCNPANVADLVGQPDVDGALVGGASLDAGSFAAMCEAARRAGARA